MKNEELVTLDENSSFFIKKSLIFPHQATSMISRVRALPCFRHKARQ